MRILSRLILLLTLAACAAPADAPHFLTEGEIATLAARANEAAPQGIAARGAALRARAATVRRTTP